MGFQAWITIAAVLGVMLAMAFTNLAADLVLGGAVLVLLLAGVLTPEEAARGMGQPLVLSIGVLFIIGAGIRETGAGHLLGELLLGRPKTTRQAIARVTFAPAFFSAFMNNTPLVAMMIPVVQDWSRKAGFSASKLLLPMNYAVVLGGCCSLIGTSTNLVVKGQLDDYTRRIEAKPTDSGVPFHLSQMRLGMFTVAAVGAPAAVAGILFVLAVGPAVLPNRTPAMTAVGDPREYTVEMLVPEGSSLVGKNIEQAGLRSLPGVYLAEIDRNGAVFSAVSPMFYLQTGDRLVFVGQVDSVADLQKTRGLLPATDQVFKLDTHRGDRCLVEAVVSNSCPNVGQTIRDGRFRSIYQAVVIAVAREGERLRGKIGDIVLRAGDTLLLETSPSFEEQHRSSRDFFLIRRLEDAYIPRHDRAWLALALLVGMVAVVSMNDKWLMAAAMVAALLMVLLGCCSLNSARKSIDWSTLASIAASFGLAAAVSKSGLDTAMAEIVNRVSLGNPYAALAGIYLMTLITTEILTNNAAALLMFPFAMATAAKLGVVNPMSFIVTVMMAASAAFATPFGYQTNLMVYGPGGYRFSDYLRLGIPLDILVGLIAVALAPLVWPFK